ncbi:MAG: ABC transporter ATP-binding protein [Verrucomicrobiota bacterium]
MSQPVIRVEGLGKRYFIGHQMRHDTLRDRLAHGARGLLRRWRNPGDLPAVEEFWALRDVSFEVNEGDVVGIIGRNGAGKSTLLKILSRITEPTTGRATIRGRVASLLEVGTGFHPELTGRENIFLNGAILGMSRAEITRKFDEIVAFAEVERFLDTPVKHYSSGMYVRLAFAVAAHLEPEILIVDEVLAVGDAAFQKKCLGKMKDVTTQGRTVFFVSHNLGQVRALCNRAILLRSGRLECAGPVQATLARYQSEQSPDTAAQTLTGPLAGAVRLTGIRLQGTSVGSGQCTRTDPAELVVEAVFTREIARLRATVALFADGIRLCTAHEPGPSAFTRTAAGRLTFTCRLPVAQLAPGMFQIGLGFCDGHPERYAWNPACYHFSILEDEQQRGSRDELGLVTLPLVISRQPDRD